MAAMLAVSTRCGDQLGEIDTKVLRICFQNDQMILGKFASMFSNRIELPNHDEQIQVTKMLFCTNSLHLPSSFSRL